MPNETPPNSSRKNPDSASMRTWNGRSGRPAGRIAALGGAPIAHSPVTASASDTSAPTGNAAPVMSRGVRINASPITPSPIQITASVTTASIGRQETKSIYAVGGRAFKMPGMIAPASARAQAGRTLSDFQKFLTASQPALEMALGAPGMITQQLRRDIARRFEKIDILFQIGEAQHRHAALARTQQLPRAAQAQIVARDLEAVGILVDDAQTLARIVRKRVLV